jgi:hypothetical protein
MSSAVIGALRVNLGANTAEFERGLKSAQTGMRGIEAAAKRMAGVLATAFSGAAIARSMQGAVNAFASFEKQQLITEQVLKSTGFAAGRTAEQLERLARGIGSATLASTQEVRDAANQLLTFRSIAGETFDRTLRAAQDLATVGFGSLSSTTQQLAKALEDPINGLNSLRRAGVSFSDEQRRVIKAFVETGDTAAAQAEILKAVEAQVGGAGAAAGGGLAGAYDTLSEEVKLFTERTGRQIAVLTNLQGVIQSITGLLSMERVNSDPVEQALARIEQRTKNIADMRRAMESGSGSSMLMQQQIDALEAANATDRLAVANARLRTGMQELNATRQSEIAQEEIRRNGLGLSEEATNRLGAGMRRVSDGMSEIGREVARIFEATRTPSERLAKEIERLNELVQAGHLDWDTYGRAVKKAQQDFDDASASGNQLASTLSSSFSNMFQGLISGTQSAGQAISGLLKQLAGLLVNRAFTALLGGAGGGGGLLGSLFGGFRANGGPVSSGKAYVVGERGPELMVPGMSGQVISNENLRGGNGGPLQIEVLVSPTGEFDARVANVADQRATVIVRTNNRAIPGIVADAQRRAG